MNQFHQGTVVGQSLDLQAARDCDGCMGWATLVAPGGRGLVLCGKCQEPTEPSTVPTPRDGAHGGPTLRQAYPAPPLWIW